MSDKSSLNSIYSDPDNCDDKVMKISPWNESNKLLTKNDILDIYSKCGFKNVENVIKINDLELYQTAFVHSSYINKRDKERQ